MLKSTSNNLQSLIFNLATHSRLAIAFSAGIDSSLLLAAACQALDTDRILALTATSPLQPATEMQRAQSLAQKLGVRWQPVTFNPLHDPNFVSNPPERCYLCKKMMLSALLRTAEKSGFSLLAEGSNHDDLADFRPGFKAVMELQAISPLLEVKLGKDAIRALATELELPNAKLPADACLASRLPFHTPITPERLNRVEQAEQYLYQAGFAGPLRIRDYGDLCRIEITIANFPQLFEQNRREYIANLLKTCGYHHITLDLCGYQPGSLNPKTKKLLPPFNHTSKLK